MRAPAVRYHRANPHQIAGKMIYQAEKARFTAAAQGRRPIVGVMRGFLLRLRSRCSRISDAAIQRGTSREYVAVWLYWAGCDLRNLGRRGGRRTTPLPDPKSMIQSDSP